MKGKKADLSGAGCGIARALHVIGDWWTLLIVREAFIGRQRFSEFQKSLGLARNILSTRLKKLVDEGIFQIEIDNTAPSVHRYALTAKGEQLYIVLNALWQWGEKFCFVPDELKYAIVDCATEKPVARLQLKAQDGRTLGPRDFRLVLKPAPAPKPTRRVETTKSGRRGHHIDTPPVQRSNRSTDRQDQARETSDVRQRKT